jgi:capsule polysaccharide export protein KpsE/RkpR
LKNSRQTITRGIEQLEESSAMLSPGMDMGTSTSELKSEDRLLNAAQAVWNQRLVLVRWGIWGALAMALLALLIPNHYNSTTRLMPPENKAGAGLALITAMSGAAGGGGIPLSASLLDMNSSGALFMGILRSRTVEARLVDKFDLRTVYWFAWSEKAAREKLEGNTDISEDRKSGILTITVADTNRQRAHQLAQSYVEELDRLVSQLSTSSAHRERVFLEGRLAAVKQDLDSAQKEFSQFASKNSTIDIKEQGKAMVEGAATLQGELIAAQSELKGLEQIYANNNARVRTVRARVQELQRQLGKLVGTDSVQQGSTEGTSSEADASRDESGYPSIRQLPLLGVNYADLYRRTRIQETVYETLTKEYEMAKVQEAKEIPSVKVLDLANIPEKKSFPPTIAMTWSGFTLGLICAIVWVLVDDKWERLDAGDPRKVFANEVLSTLRCRIRSTRRRDLPRIFLETVFRPRSSSNGSNPL